ncbi:unnamed protein product [Trifolium pratense]|uniref:Uncharacterized protein n=1 Tax=Trifolium pratense TaxID=57577 RepID=A0ACB0KDS2_TRIPR|nr:unnamed protein product [Trifolium pratense]
MEKKSVLYLPHELMIEILLKLPVKSLICFKCVCKSWFSLISDPHFANSHFQLTTHTHRIMCVSNSPTEFCSIDFEAFVNYDPRLSSLSMNFSLPGSHLPFKIIGSCRGFILLYRRRDIFLWNPSTGFKKQISLSPLVFKLVTNYGYDNLFGFGYDQSRDDYLVVVLYHDPTVANSFSSHLEFFSIRDNRWKEIEGTHLPSYDLIYSKGLLFNGVIHWLALRSDLESDLEIKVIVAFDLTERKLFEMPLPSDYDYEVNLDLGL